MKPYEMTSEAFVGPVLLSESFAIDGRKDEDYAWIWEEDPSFHPLLPSSFPLDGYRIHHLWGYEPEGSVLLAAPDGSVCGFYLDAQCWIDPEHRGAGLSTPMILAAAELLGGSPVRPNDGCPVGFSEAGHKAHLAAHAASVAWAARRGIRLPEAVAAEYGLDERTR